MLLLDLPRSEPLSLDALVVFGNSRLVDFDTLLVDSTSTADCIVNILCLDMLRQSA